MSPTVQQRERLLADLADESRWLTDLVDGLTKNDLDLPTPAVGWTVADQIRHITRFDEVTVTAVSTPEHFIASREAELAGTNDVAELWAARDRAMTGSVMPSDALAAASDRLLTTLAEADWSVRVPWYGPSMGVASTVTARLMEKFAHGQDIADALGVNREPALRHRHVADLGYRTLAFSFVNRGLATPTAPVRVELRGSSEQSEILTWGAKSARDLVVGSLLEFCLVVTRRRRAENTDLTIEGPVAAKWMTIAQTFAGPPGRDPQPLPAVKDAS